MLFPEDENMMASSELLRTIRFPKNFMYLTNQLPKPSYNEEVDEDFIENIKSSTLPFKPKPKNSAESLLNRVSLSRSKANTAGKHSDLSERIGSNSSASKQSKNMSRAKNIMKTNLSKKEGAPQIKYKDIIKGNNNLIIKTKKVRFIIYFYLGGYIKE